MRNLWIFHKNKKITQIISIWVKALPTAAMLCRCNIYKKTSVETDSLVWLSVSTEVVRFITVCLY